MKAQSGEGQASKNLVIGNPRGLGRRNKPVKVSLAYRSSIAGGVAFRLPRTTNSMSSFYEGTRRRRPKREKVISISFGNTGLVEERARRHQDSAKFLIYPSVLYPNSFQIIYSDMCLMPNRKKMLVFSPCILEDEIFGRKSMKALYYNQLFRIVNDEVEKSRRTAVINAGLSSKYFDCTVPCSIEHPDTTEGQFALSPHVYEKELCCDGAPVLDPVGVMKRKLAKFTLKKGIGALLNK